MRGDVSNSIGVGGRSEWIHLQVHTSTELVLGRGLYRGICFTSYYDYQYQLNLTWLWMVLKSPENC